MPADALKERISKESTVWELVCATWVWPSPVFLVWVRLVGGWLAQVPVWFRVLGKPKKKI